MRRVIILSIFMIGIGYLFSGAGYTLAAGTRIQEGAFITTSTPADASPHFPNRCLKCHAAMGDCALCHAEDLPGDTHPDLFACAACHQPPVEAGQGRLAWQAVRIDHASPQLANCQACHAVMAPPGHYQAPCSSCHTPPASGSNAGWSNISMDHQAAGLSDCQSCHANSRPANHFSRQCSACHNTTGWRGVRFNHLSASDCQGCHKSPRSHYGNQCKQCHTPGTAWTNASLKWHKFNMDHGGADGRCSTCHTRQGTNCTSCHEAEEEDDDD